MRTLGGLPEEIGLDAKFRCLIIDAVVLNLERLDGVGRIDF